MKVKNSGLGCFIRNVCFNAFMYADDILMLSISVEDLQSMLNICNQELQMLDMSVNVKKSSYIRIGKRFDTAINDLYIDDQLIACTGEIKYLGVTILCGKNFKCDLHKAKIKYFGSLNALLGKMGSVPSISLTLSLINTFCLPTLTYGLKAIGPTKKQIDSVSYPYNAAFMKIFNSFDKKVISQCQFYCGYLPLHYLLDSCTLNFYSKLCRLDGNPANTLFKWFGLADREKINNKYNISCTDNCVVTKDKIWNCFAELINSVNV